MIQYQTEEKIRLKYDAIKAPKGYWKGKTVLDVGCCEGMLYPLLKGCKYIGLDNDQEYIESAKERYPDAKFVLGNMKELNIEADIIISLSTLHILDDREFEEFVKNSTRLTRVLIFECPVKGTSPLYHTRTEKQLEEICRKYYKNFTEIGISPSPHDIQSTRKVFRCEN